MIRKMHYAGAVRTPRMNILGGWAACCSGEKAERIKAEGLNTYDIGGVTCAACKRTMAKDARLAVLLLDPAPPEEPTAPECNIPAPDHCSCAVCDPPTTNAEGEES